MNVIAYVHVVRSVCLSLCLSLSLSQPRHETWAKEGAIASANLLHLQISLAYMSVFFPTGFLSDFSSLSFFFSFFLSLNF